MHNIQDWCISRQLWWGHRIPAWYDDAGNVYVGRDEAEVRRKHALGPKACRCGRTTTCSTRGSRPRSGRSRRWAGRTRLPALTTFYPTNVLVTSFDIIFFWVARMIMMGLKFMGDVPFREVYIHALVRDHEGQKMSKSKGNILDPLDLIDGVDLETLLKKRTDGLMQTHLQANIEKATRKEFPNGIEGVGTDALRFTFASLATTGRDARFDLSRAEGYHRFCNKLWNASAYVLSQLDGAPAGAAELGLADRWIRSRLDHAIREVHAGFASYRLDLVAQTLYDFAWHELCDWYLELTKAVLTDTQRRSRAAQRRAAHARRHARRAAEAVASVDPVRHRGTLARAVPADRGSEPHGHARADARTRRLRARRGSRGRDRLAQDVRRRHPPDPRRLEPAALDRPRRAARGRDGSRQERASATQRASAGSSPVSSVSISCTPGASVKGAATALLGAMRILVPLAGLIDVASERDRLGKQLAKTRDDAAKSRRKLDNQSFVANAPAEIVAKENARIAELEQRAAQLEQQLARLAEIG